MELQNYYWCFPGALPHRICDDIVAYGKALKEETGVTFGFDPDNMTPNQQKQLEQKRKSNVVWMDPVWIYRELHPLVHEANANAGWNYHWDCDVVLLGAKCCQSSYGVVFVQHSVDLLSENMANSSDILGDGAVVGRFENVKYA